MKAISRIISVFFFAIGFTNVTSANLRMNEVEDVKSNKVGWALQVYDEVVTICESKGVALQLCTNTLHLLCCRNNHSNWIKVVFIVDRGGQLLQKYAELQEQVLPRLSR
jgi:hypothetical protein